jgi:hypothetical protein
MCILLGLFDPEDEGDMFLRNVGLTLKAAKWLDSAFTLVSCSAYSTLKNPSEMSVDFQRTTWRYIPEDSILHNHSCENLKSYKKSSKTAPFRYKHHGYQQSA